MQMTLEADYAVRIVELLAASGQRLDAKLISEKTKVPQRFSLKILRTLVEHDIISSYKGAHGGYSLSREPEHITLREVIEAVEGPFMISRCQKNEYECGHTECRFHKIYAEVSELVRDKLDSCTFSDAQK